MAGDAARHNQTQEPGEPGLDVAALSGMGLDSRVLMAAPIAVYAVDLSGRIVLWNDAAAVLFGWTADEVMHRLPPFIPEEEVDRAIQALGLVISGRPLVQETFTPRRRDNRRFNACCWATLVRDGDGQPLASLTFVRDVTVEMDAREQLAAAEHKWRQLAMRSADTITISSADGHMIESTGEFKATLGYPSEWWKDNTGFALLHPGDVRDVIGFWQTIAASPPGTRDRRVFRARHRDGHYEQVEFTVVNLLDDPDINAIVVANREMSPQKQAERLLADEAKLFQLIALEAPVEEVLAEVVHVVEYHTGCPTGAFLVDEYTGALQPGARGTLSDELVALIVDTQMERLPAAPSRSDDGGVDDDQAVADEAAANVATRAVATGWHRVGHADAFVDLGFSTAWNTPVIETRSGRLFGLITTFVADPRQSTAHEQKVMAMASHVAAIALARTRRQQQLWQQARYDPLTGLPNRSLIFETLDEALTHARVRRQPVAVMLIDLDRFKIINDSLGHAVGDQLISRFADRLREVIGMDGFVGHMDADEFVVVFTNGEGLGKAERTAARVVRALEEPFTVGNDDNIYLTASIGMAMSESGRENANTLLQQADAAMLQAKDLGRDRTEVFDERLRTRAVERLEVDRDLRVALERGELLVHFQPEIDCLTGRIAGAEVLLRWQHPERGLLTPESFIGVAEDTGTIVPVGHWVLDQAIRQARAWTDEYPEIAPFTISVNLSARQLINRSLVDTVAFVLTRYNWPPSHLTLELTESILIEDRDATLYVLNRLRLLGVKLAIDDFGTGFASLDYLHRLHVDSIKIDRLFVSMLDSEGKGSPVATAMMHMADSFELTVIAEGVEEQHQYDGLKALGCDMAQGFLFSRPQPADEIGELLRSDRRW